ncbi:hypothetical protein BLNAU_2988 [Blattamonas nauphoetae]|uniref:Shugoshin C-terminal domain-containing protein n=1 Tax=Blattamonas nauphoetae TaxID=2049346 RepID=A0ABQ9YDT5_9EUKA|nr:hypothetical protein BLNAU_2988 [Blattamonas nauphoetae]
MDQIGQETVSALERMISEEEKVCVKLFGSIQRLQTRTKYLETHNHFVLLDNLLSLITLLSNTQAIMDDAPSRPFIPSPNLHFTHLITSSLHDEANSEQQLSHSLSTDSSNPKHAVFTELFSDLSRISHLPMVVPLSSSATQPSQESIDFRFRQRLPPSESLQHILARQLLQFRPSRHSRNQPLRPHIVQANSLHLLSRPPSCLNSPAAKHQRLSRKQTISSTLRRPLSSNDSQDSPKQKQKDEKEEVSEESLGVAPPSLMRPKEEEEKEPRTEMLIDQSETNESDVQKKEKYRSSHINLSFFQRSNLNRTLSLASESQDDSGTIDDSPESAPKSNTFAPKPDPQLDPHPHSRRDLISSDAELFSSSDDAHPPIPRSSLTDSNADEYTPPTSQSMVGLKKKKPRKSARFSADRSTKLKRIERQCLQTINASVRRKEEEDGDEAPTHTTARRTATGDVADMTECDGVAHPATRPLSPQPSVSLCSR